MTNDILNNLFENPIIKCGVGRPKKKDDLLEDQSAVRIKVTKLNYIHIPFTY